MKNGWRTCAWVCGWALVGCLLDGCSGDDGPTPTAVDSGGSDRPPDLGGDGTPLDAEDTAGDEADGADADDDADAEPIDAGTPADCRTTTTMDKYFTLPIGSSKCLVAEYDLAAAGLSAVTWGRHGGPLWFDGSTTSLVRAGAPSGATGDLAVATKKLSVSGVPSGAYWGNQAVDVGFFDWTAVAYTASGTGFPGEVILANGAGTLTRYNVNGYFSAVGIPLMSTSGGRLLHTGLSPIGTSA